MSVVLQTETQRQHALRDLYHALEKHTTPPRGFAQDESGVVAALGPAPMTNRAWFLERYPPPNASSEDAKPHVYRGYCFNPTHSQKPSTNPHDIVQGNLMREQLVTCQAFVLNFPTETFEHWTGPADILRIASEQFTPTIRDGRHVIEKTTVGSAPDVLSLYQRTRRQPPRQ